MSYTVYKSEAIVLRIIPQGEASLDVVFFTKEFGKVTARVQSARNAESKMRMHLVRYNHIMIDLVRGRSVWRLIGITHTGNIQKPFFNNDVLRSLHRVIRFSEFLIQGEDPHPDVFNLFRNLLDYSNYHTATNIDAAQGLELFGVVKILEKLGYWNGELFPDVPQEDLLALYVVRRKSLVKEINESISATQIVVS